MLKVHYNFYFLLFTYTSCVICMHVYVYILALVEPSYALLLTTCHPKAVGGVCHATNYQ